MRLGGPEIAVICVIMLLLFGPSQLPKLGRSIGQTVKEFRNIGKDLRDGDDE